MRFQGLTIVFITRAEYELLLVWARPADVGTGR
jgi:hypothetical protein